LKNGEFVINFCDWSIIDKVHYCGRHSGRKFDKFAETGLTPVPAQSVKVPIIKEAYCSIECRLAEHHMYGDHTWFVGEVLSITADPVFNDDLLNQDVQSLFYLGNNTYTSFNNEQKRY
jgi:flavin reductase (DIM6/NTAB) family NADH-FMN oxidoreductase RutF